MEWMRNDGDTVVGSATAVTCVTRKDTVCTVKEVGGSLWGKAL